MTAEKSDAQLDAEAAVSLRDLIIEIRRSYWYEVREKLHQRQTTSGVGDELDEKGWPKDADEGGLGPPFSSWWHSYLRTNQGPHNKGQWDRGPDPRVRPTAASIVNESERCHAMHTSHQRPGYTLSLCAEMMRQVAYHGQEPEDLAWHFDLPEKDVRSMLLSALRHAREWRVDQEARWTKIPGEAEPMPERRPIRPAA